MADKRYLIEHRLSDVMALIQVLALDEWSHRSEKGLEVEMQGPPHSAQSWPQLASEHPEFFRVKKDGKRGIALVARHVKPKEDDDEKPARRQPLDDVFTGELLRAAIELHDRQIKREDRWAITVPIWAAVITGIVACFLKFGEVVIALCKAAH